MKMIFIPENIGLMNGNSLKTQGESADSARDILPDCMDFYSKNRAYSISILSLLLNVS